VEEVKREASGQRERTIHKVFSLVNHLSQQGKSVNGSLGRPLGKKITFKQTPLNPLLITQHPVLNAILISSLTGILHLERPQPSWRWAFQLDQIAALCAGQIDKQQNVLNLHRRHAYNSFFALIFTVHKRLYN
jgi:hypothetical protein